MNTLVRRCHWMKATHLMLGGLVAGLVVMVAISRSGGGIEGGGVFLVLLIGLLTAGLLMLRTKDGSSTGSTAGVLKPRDSAHFETIEGGPENLPDPLDEGFDIPL